MSISAYQLMLLNLFVFAYAAAFAQSYGVYEKKKLSETEIKSLFAYYKQNGEHSAVTGGRGTERLSVFSAETDVILRFDTVRQVFFGAGLDYITSASTDKIDFMVSSASRHDQRIYTHFGYGHSFENRNISIGAELHFSLESDYYSRGIHTWVNKSSVNGDFELNVNLYLFQDDLRWRKTFYRPTELIYPEELRDTTWFTIHHRNSYNMLVSFRKDINRRMTVILYPGLIVQRGLLSTPFHRVYFQGSFDPKVETLPQNRVRFPIGIQWNSFILDRIVTRVYYQYYTDNFGIRSNTVNLELPVKQGTFVTFTPFVRFYQQSGSNYFKPFKEHILDQMYFSSDYDLSEFSSWKFGLEFKTTSNKKIFKRGWLFDQFSIRYAYYSRSDGLAAHMVTTVFNIKK